MSQNKPRAKTKEPKAPTTQEWLKELESVLFNSQNDGGLTMIEIMEETHLSIWSLRKRLKKLFEEGRLIVGRRDVPTIAGNVFRTPTYKIMERKRDG